MNKRKKDTSTWLRYIVNIWTFVLFAGVILNMLDIGISESALGPIAALYVGALVVYSAEKEFERWAEYYHGRHPGEIYVILWTILMFSLSLVSFTIHKEYKIPSEIISSYIAVLSILAITKKSKSFYREKKGKK